MTGATAKIIWLILALVLIETTAGKLDWIQCHQMVPGCTCRWVGGKRTANCENANTDTIPHNLSDEIQSLILDNNNITVLQNGIFQRRGLMNLQKLSLRNCSVREIEKNAFHGLEILIDIDLTGNEIRKIDPATFGPTKKLRHVYLNRNALQEVGEGTFSNMKFLQTVVLDDNRISHIGKNAFSLSPQMKSIKLNGNQLTHVELDIFEGISLGELQLRGNPWKCDCHLREFIVWYVDRLYTDPTTCAEPEYLQNMTWRSIDPNKFTCTPDILSSSTLTPQRCL